MSSQIYTAEEIKKVKTGVKKLLDVLSKDIEFNNDDKTRAILKSRKEAFISAYELIVEVNKMEHANGKKVDGKWYILNINELILKGKNAITLMYDGISSAVSDISDDARNSDILAKRDAIRDIAINKKCKLTSFIEEYAE